MCLTRYKEDYNNLDSPGTIETLFFKTGWTGSPLSTRKCMWWDWGCWGPSLGPFLLFFPGQSQSSLVSWPPLPHFYPLGPSLCPQGSVVPRHPPSRSSAPRTGATSEVSSLSEHAFPCSKQAGGQQRLSRLSDRGAERPRRKGVQPLGCKALVGTAEVLPPDSPFLRDCPVTRGRS